jgi:hypothetical protein
MGEDIEFSPAPATKSSSMSIDLDDDFISEPAPAKSAPAKSAPAKADDLDDLFADL